MSPASSAGTPSIPTLPGDVAPTDTNDSGSSASRTQTEVPAVLDTNAPTSQTEVPAAPDDEMQSVDETAPSQWANIASIVRTGASVVKDILPIARTITSSSYDAAKQGTKFGFGVADACLDRASQGMQMVGAEGAAGLVSAVAGTVQGIGAITDASISASQRIACSSLDAASSSLEYAGVRDGAAGDLLRRGMEGVVEVETVGALGTILSIASRFTGEVEGGIDFMSLPTIYGACTALCELQHMGGWAAAPEGETRQFRESTIVRRYLRFALAAFGKDALTFMGVTTPRGEMPHDTRRLNRPAEEAVASVIGIRSQDVIRVEQAGTEVRSSPAYFICIDRAEKNIVVAFRGTMSVHDVLTDLVCNEAAVDPLDGDGGGIAHGGMLEAATALASSLRPEIEQLLVEQGAGYGVVFCGYSLGAGVATLVSRFWHNQLVAHDEQGVRDIRVQCYAYAPPCVLSLEVAVHVAPFVTSIVVGHDVVSQLSLSSGKLVRDCILKLHSEGELVTRITERAGVYHNADTSEEERARIATWAHKVLEDIQIEFPVRVGLYPAGRVLWFALAEEEVVEPEVVETSPNQFGNIILTKAMISTHMPAVYAKTLRLA